MITKVSIKNFKSLKEVNFDLPQFAVIVGYNGAGKTNLLTAIKLISNLTNGKQINAAFELLNLWPDEFYYDNNTPVAEFTLDLVIKSKSIKYTFEIKKESPEAEFSIGREVMWVQGEVVLHREGASPITIKQDNDNASKDNSPIVSNQLALAVLQGSKYVNEVRSWFSKVIVDTFEPLILKSYGTSSKENISSTGILAEKLYHLKLRQPQIYTDIIGTFRKIIPGLENVDVEVNTNGGIVLSFKEKNIEKQYHSFSASNGNLRAMGIVLAMYGRPKPSAIFIDEIENSLHPSRINSIIRLLQYLAEDELEKVQIIMTTHNPIVLDYVKAEQIVYSYRKDGMTNFVNPYKNQSVMYELQKSEENNISLRNLFASGLLEEILTSEL